MYPRVWYAPFFEFEFWIDKKINLEAKIQKIIEPRPHFKVSFQIDWAVLKHQGKFLFRMKHVQKSDYIFVSQFSQEANFAQCWTRHPLFIIVEFYAFQRDWILVFKQKYQLNNLVSVVYIYAEVWSFESIHYPLESPRRVKSHLNCRLVQCPWKRCRKSPRRSSPVFHTFQLLLDPF